MWMRCLRACVPCSVCVLHFAPGNYCAHGIGRWGAGKGRSQRREALDRADAKRPKTHTRAGQGTRDTHCPSHHDSGCHGVQSHPGTRPRGGEGSPVPRGCLAWERARRGRGRPQFEPHSFRRRPHATDPPSQLAIGRSLVAVAQTNRNIHLRRIPAVVIVFQSKESPVPACSPFPPSFPSRGANPTATGCRDDGNGPTLNLDLN